MEHKIFAIYDQKAEAYLPPFTLPQAAMAQRTFSDCCNSDDHQFGLHPADYTLVELGTYDVQTGQIMPYEVHKSLGIGIEYLREKSPLNSGTENGQPIGDVSSILSSAER